MLLPLLLMEISAKSLRGKCTLKKHWVISDADVRAGYITPLVGKKIDAEKYGWPLLRQCMYHSVGFISKMPIWEVHLPPLSGVKWRLGALICSARLLLETLNTCQSSPETC